MGSEQLLMTGQVIAREKIGMYDWDFIRISY